MKNLEVPKNWSQLATDILASKYCRRAQVPGTNYENSAKKVVHRISHTIRSYGEKHGYFKSGEEAGIFEAELSHILINQKGAFNSPVWFNVGLFHQYGIKGNGGNYSWDPETNTICETKEMFPENPCYWLCSNALILNDNLSKVAGTNLNGVSLHHSIINEKLMERSEDLGLEVYSWTVDNPEEAKRLIALEVKGITTNRPGWLREQIQ